jgi:hypothetical protein
MLKVAIRTLVQEQESVNLFRNARDCAKRQKGVKFLHIKRAIRNVG